jgi:D-aminopeptidase
VLATALSAARAGRIKCDVESNSDLVKKHEVSTMSTVRGSARAQGIPFDGLPGENNAIIDVSGVGVGHDQNSAGDIQTGVTAILPIGIDEDDGVDTFVLAAFFSINGNGEMTGTHLIEETGFLEGPIMLTNTVSVGCVRSWVIKYALANPGKAGSDDFGLIEPVVAETYDGYLNNILSFDVTQDMVNNAIKNASPDNTQEGNIGAGTGTTCYSWKGGIGTASRRVLVYQQKDNKTPINNPNLDPKQIQYFTVGALVQANQGTYWDLVIRGVPMGQDEDFAPPPQSPDIPPGQGLPKQKARKSSIIVVIATDAPLLPNQLKRLARRATHGIARTGTITNDDSGELVVAFTTANLDAADENKVARAGLIPNDSMDPLFEATVQATEEAILNALCAGVTVKGYQKNVAYAITDPPPRASAHFKQSWQSGVLAP